MAIHRRSRDFRRNEDALIAAIDANRSHPEQHRQPDPNGNAGNGGWRVCDVMIFRGIADRWNHLFPNWRVA